MATSPTLDQNEVRPRRSVLYMPGTNRRAHEKARDLPADVLIFDLEDSVAPDAKADARAAVLEAVSSGGYGNRELVVRINSLDTPWGEADLWAAAAVPISAVLLPKVENPEAVRRVGDALETQGQTQGQGQGPTTCLWVMMETTRAILAAEEIADSHPGLQMMCMGLEDLATELRADNGPPRTSMLYALERCVLVARAYGLGVLDGVYPAFDDDEGFAAACAQGRALGFDGKQLIHPRQVAAANAAFAPSQEAVMAARKVIEAFEAAKAAGEGITVLDGRMIEALHVEEARRIVALADQLTGHG